MSNVDLTVCIVTYKARDLLRDCLNSLYKNAYNLKLEVIVVDNGSKDGVGEMLQREFQSVRFIGREENIGFSRPMNQALRVGRGQYLLLLNPDTVIIKNAPGLLVDFMIGHPEVGICGPKVLNRDGSLQKPCRRGESRPWAVISYFAGLSSLFPKSKLFGEYLMGYMNEDETHSVAGVSGSCMLVRRKVFEQVGYLDERFFAYQEDADICFRARKAGWKVYYYPKAQITHYGSLGGSRVNPYRSIFEWHKSYYLFYRKNLSGDYIFIFNYLYYLSMFVKLIFTLLLNFVRTDKFAGSRKP